MANTSDRSESPVETSQFFQDAWAKLFALVELHRQGKLEASTHIQMDGHLGVLTIHTRKPIDTIIAEMEDGILG